MAVSEAHMPPLSVLGRTRKTSLREVVNAIFHIAQAGYHWRMLTMDVPLFTTVHL